VEASAGRIALIEKNRHNFGAANLEIVHGTMPDILDRCLAAYSRPQRIFFGGGLNGRAEDAADAGAAGQIFRKAWNALLPGGRMVIHCVLLSTLECVRALLARTGAAAEVSCIQVSQSVPLAGDIRLQALNPVFLVSADKQENAAAI
jgi:precorrin-6Y C5,15-methyltransferase (decarboxylating)